MREDPVPPKDTEIEIGDIYLFDDRLAVVVDVELDESETRAMMVSVRIGDEVREVHPSTLRIP
jgi:hypothetical protein